MKSDVRIVTFSGIIDSFPHFILESYRAKAFIKSSCASGADPKEKGKVKPGTALYSASVVKRSDKIAAMCSSDVSQVSRGMLT